MAEDAGAPVFPRWMRVGLVLALTFLTLAYLAAPLFGVKAEMPTMLEVAGGGAFAAVLGNDVWHRLTQ